MSKSNPFRPGYGLLPPYLAGREKEQKLFNSSLEAMVIDEVVNGVVMYGPRGMGKTALLRWLEGQCSEKDIGHIRRTSATMLGSVEALANTLLPVLRSPDGWSVNRVDIGGRWLNVGVSSPTQGTGKEADLADVLINRCRKKPMVLLLDEAHGESDPDTFRILLHTAQQVAQEAPFLLVLAGTPGLAKKLRNSGTTFIERAELIGLDRLDDEEAAAALSIPLEKGGVTITENALNEVVKESQCYPFFVQRWGKALWDHAVERGISELTQDDVRLLTTDIQTMRNAFYEQRYREIEESPELLAVANALAQALLKDEKGLDRSAIAAIIKNNIGAAMPDDADIESKAKSIIDELIRQDFFWHPPTSRLIVPGIPSFMTYVSSHSKR